VHVKVHATELLLAGTLELPSAGRFFLQKLLGKVDYLAVKVILGGERRSSRRSVVMSLLLLYEIIAMKDLGNNSPGQPLPAT